MSRSKEEALAAGVKIAETKHHMKRRRPWHNYRHKGTYMLTIAVEGRLPLLGKLKMEPSSQESSADGISASVELTPLGKVIRDEEVQKISACFKMVEVWKLCIMPDHIHMILRVTEDLPEGKHLGQIVAGFKGGCSRAWWRLSEIPAADASGREATAADAPGREATAADASGREATAADAPGREATAADAPGRGAITADAPGREAIAADAPGREAIAADAPGRGASPADAPGRGASLAAALPATTLPAAFAPLPAASAAGKKPSLFESGYNDQILLNDGQLDNWKHYLDDNPRRLAIKRLHPDYFTVTHHADIAEWHCQIVGNRFLLGIPDKVAVIVHRGYSDAEFADYKQKWLACGEAGGVLVSASIATREKEVMREAMNRGYRLILVRENGFPPMYKPAGESFDACSDGRLLQVSPWPYHMERRTISREQCLILNRLVTAIVEGR
jgi:hypothetical protein